MPDAIGRRPGLAGWQVVVGAFVLTRLLMLLMGWSVGRHRGRSAHDLISAWDVQHFEAIAVNGYAVQLDRAFFPGLPLVLRAAHALGLPMGGFGVVLSTICTALAAWALYRLGGTWAACWWLAAPMAIFTSVAYTEAPFCAAAFWAWERARAKDWVAACLLACVATSFRISGLFLIGALGLLALTQTGVGWRRRLWHSALAALPLLVIVAYFAHLHALTGSWTEWFTAQQTGWSRGFTNPVEAFRNTVKAAKVQAWPDRPLVARVFALEIVAMVMGLVTTIWCLARRRWGEAGWVGVQVFAFATSHWFMSVNRAVLLWFPLFLMLAALATRQPRGVGNRVVWRGTLIVGWLCCVAVQLFWSWLWFTGAWAS